MKRTYSLTPSRIGSPFGLALSAVAALVPLARESFAQELPREDPAPSPPASQAQTPAPNQSPSTQAPAAPPGQAHPPQPYGTGQPYYPGYPAPEPARNASVERHDGFFLRFGLGVGALAANVSARFLDAELGIRGGVFSPEILLGGTPVEGLVFGSGIVIAGVGKPRLSGDATAALGEVTEYSLVTVPVFLNYYFDATRGLHVQGYVGVAGATAQTGMAIPVEASGFTVAAGAGYEFWIANQWSLGGFARFAYTETSTASGDLGLLSRNGEAHRAIVPTLSFIATLH